MFFLITLRAYYVSVQLYNTRKLVKYKNAKRFVTSNNDFTYCICYTVIVKQLLQKPWQCFLHIKKLVIDNFFDKIFAIFLDHFNKFIKIAQLILFCKN